MGRPRYPLESLEKLRDAQVDEQAATLGVTVEQRERAAAARARTEAERREAEEAAARLRSVEATELERGALTVADLQRADAWELRVQAERHEQERAVARAKEAERAAHAQELAARDELARRRAEADVVEEHRGRWTSEQDKRAAAKEEELAEEAWRRR